MSAADTMENVDVQLPSRAIRKLLRGRWRRARNVLVAANRCHELVRRLNRTGTHAAGIDDSPDSISSEDLPIHFGSVAGGFPFPPHAFELVMVGPCCAFDAGFNGPEPLIAIANLLSSLKPKGRLVWLNGIEATRPQSNGLVAALSRFPGEVSVGEYQDGWERFVSLEWLLGRHRDIRLHLNTLTLPAGRISRLDWHQLARRAALGRPRSVPPERAA